MPATQTIKDCRSAEEALQSLCGWFFEDRLSMEGCDPVGEHELPSAYRELLVHTEHMTARLARYHGREVELVVLGHEQRGDIYSRHILLQPAGTDHIVEFGVVRIDLACMAPAVRAGVLAREIPLGAILITHDVMRRIEPKWYLRFAADAPLTAHFGGDADVYGRVGIIHCAGQPAIELLEVVTDKRQVAGG